MRNYNLHHLGNDPLLDLTHFFPLLLGSSPSSSMCRQQRSGCSACAGVMDEGMGKYEVMDGVVREHVEVKSYGEKRRRAACPVTFSGAAFNVSLVVVPYILCDMVDGPLSDETMQLTEVILDLIITLPPTYRQCDKLNRSSGISGYVRD
ncbi:hypothetical protein DFH08DRAFT_815219 [Mycena albidolilacea]|uniref:Uncharacterized protein n=1 Tax=Mycena albidolilacea TaxID=1033008 RepID=A0AAD6ZMD7_9AGAR|nr:hypothetical protein DFH08DRAFT_815219 [Mycena albidolilacea]